MEELKIFVLCVVLFQTVHTQLSRLEIDARIINGNPARPGQFPWQAAIFFQGMNTSFWFCSGSIISKEWILTAAHCAHSANEAYIYTGITDISVEVDPTAIESNLIIHEDFVPDGLANDIAVIKLSNPLTLDDDVHAIPLSSDEVKDNVDVTISGWGQTRVDDPAISALLNYVSLVTITNEECQKAYGDSGVILDEMVCAASNPIPLQSPCHGDSGGPVVVNYGTDDVRQVAIASFVSDAGCASGLPSGYTRIEWYLDWLKEKTGITA